MLATRQPVLRRFWYPVAPSSMLDEGPFPFTLLGEKIVLWRDAGGEPACLVDRCCHRTAKLSLGFVDDDRNIVCGYHGWTFDRSGRCVRIPQRLDETRTGRIGVDAFLCEERYGHIWVCLDAEPLTGIPELPEADEPGFRRIDQFYEEWNIGALRLMENSFDHAHIAFVHRDTFGDVTNPTPVRYEIDEQEYGFSVRAEYPIKARAGLKEINLGTDAEGEDTVRRNNSNWFMPFARRSGHTYPNGLRHTIFTAATPMTDDRAMIVQFCFRNDTEDQTRAADVIAFDRAVTLEDKRILEGTEPDVPLGWDPDCVEFNMMTDRPGVRMRRMFAALLERHGEVEWRADGRAVPSRIHAAE